jgi:transposase
MWANSGKTEQRLALRAKVILLAAQGVGVKAMQEHVGLNWQSCLKWRKRFLKLGVDGLYDKAGRGRRQKIAPEERTGVIALACSTPVDGSTRWSVRKLAEATGYSKSTVQQILAAGAIKPHKISYWCGKSPDPEFAEKQAAIIGHWPIYDMSCRGLRAQVCMEIGHVEQTNYSLPGCARGKVDQGRALSGQYRHRRSG